MYSHIHIHKRTHIHSCTCPHTLTYIHTNTSICICTYVYAHTHPYTYSHTHKHTHTHTHILKQKYAHAYLHNKVYLHMGDEYRVCIYVRIAHTHVKCINIYYSFEIYVHSIVCVYHCAAYINSTYFIFIKHINLYTFVYTYI